MKYIAFQSLFLYWLCYVAKRKGVHASGLCLEHVQGTSISYRSIMVSWKSPTNSRLSSKSFFQITYKSSRINRTVVKTSQQKVVLKGLKPSTNYTITVVSCLTTRECNGNIALAIKTLPKVEASPRVIPPHSVVFAKEGYPINLPCHYQGYPEPNVTWVFNGQRMKHTTHNVTITDFESNEERNVEKVSKLLSNGSWHISSVEEHEDGGVYSCVVTNEYGTATGHVRLFVSVEPVAIGFEIKLTSEVFHKELAEKDSLLFENLADNVSTAIKTLFEEAGNVRIISIDVLNFRKGSAIAEMEIWAVSKFVDEEDFVIKIVSERLAKILTNGTQGNLGTLRVGGLELHEPPQAPRDIRVDVIGPAAITVSWSPPQDHQMFAFRNYTILYRKFGTETFLVGTTTNSDTLKAKITNLKEETAYEIHVKVANSYGHAIGEPLEVKTRTARGTNPHTTSDFDSLLLVILIAVAGFLVFLCIACGVLLLLCRRRAAKRTSVTNTSLELDQIEGNSAQDDSLLDSPHFYVNLSGAESAHLTMVPTQHVQGESRQWREIPRDMIRFREALGKGAFCEVKKGFLVKDDRTLPCAVKMLKGYATENELRNLINELNVMAIVGDHPNIVSLIGACTTGGPLWLVVKLAENGSLLDYLHHHRANNGTVNNLSPEIDLSYSDKLGLAHGIAKGMRHLEIIKCVHRDLACRNVLLGKNNTPRISDFGLSRDIYESGQYEYTEVGRLPSRWMAIESLLDYSFTVKSDVWSFGVVLWEIESAGRVPFPAMNGMEILEVLLGGYRLKKPAGCSNEIYDIMTTCWQVDPNQRPTFQDLLEVLEGLLSSTEGTSYHDNCHANDAQLENYNVDTFFEDFVEPAVSDTTGDKEHTYINIGEKYQISSAAGESLTTADTIVSRAFYKSHSLDKLDKLDDMPNSLPKRGSLDRLISIHDLPDDPPQVPSYDRLLSMNPSPQNSPKPPSYDRLLGFKGSPNNPRRSTYVNGCPARFHPGYAKQGLKPKQSCHDRLESWCDGILEPSDTEEDTYDHLWLRKVSSPQNTVDQSASPTADSCGKETCHLYPDLSQRLNEQGPYDKLPDTAPDKVLRRQSHSENLSRVVANEGNDNTRTGARQVLEDRSSPIPIDLTVDNRSDMRSLDNAPEVAHVSTACYDKLSIKRPFEDLSYDANPCYNRLCTDGSYIEKNSCLNGRSLHRSIPGLLSNDNTGAYYCRIRDSGIVCDDCYCEIELSSNHSDTCEVKLLQDGDALYDTIGNHTGFSEEVECMDENQAEGIYATINIYDSSAEIQQIQIISDEAQLTDATVSAVVCDDCKPVHDPQSNAVVGTQSDTYGTKPRVPLIPDKLNTASLTQNNGEMPEDRTTRALGNEREAVMEETASDTSTTNSFGNAEEFTVDEKQSEATKSEKSLHDEISEMLHNT